MRSTLCNVRRVVGVMMLGWACQATHPLIETYRLPRHRILGMNVQDWVLPVGKENERSDSVEHPTSGAVVMLGSSAILQPCPDAASAERLCASFVAFGR